MNKASICGNLASHGAIVKGNSTFVNNLTDFGADMNKAKSGLSYINGWKT